MSDEMQLPDLPPIDWENVPIKVCVLNKSGDLYEGVIDPLSHNVTWEKIEDEVRKADILARYSPISITALYENYPL